MTESSSHNNMRALPPLWWQRYRAVEILQERLQQHIVGLLLSGTLNYEPQYYFYTGLLLQHGDILVWITAGHNIDNILDALNTREFKISQMCWLDGYEHSAAAAIPVTHRTDLVMKSWLSENLDLGAIVLPLLDAEALRSNAKNEVFQQRIGDGRVQADLEGYYVVGYPRVWNDHKKTPEGGNKVRMSIAPQLACLPVEPMVWQANESESEFWSTPDDFYGHLIKYPDVVDFKIEDIKGMSGGPVIGLFNSEDGRLGYRWVGIQSQWLPDSAIVRAIPVDKISMALERWP